MGGRENKKDNKNKTKPLCVLVTYLNDKRPSHLSHNNSCSSEVSAKLKMYAENVDRYVRDGKHLSIRSYLYICMCSFIFTLSAGDIKRESG